MADRVVNLRDFPKVSRNRFLLPADVVRVDRGSPWGNPYKITPGSGMTIADRDAKEAAERLRVLREYAGYATNRARQDPDWLTPLQGKRLACWCAPLPCHANILIEIMEGKVTVDTRLVFGVDRLPQTEAEAAPAWPSLGDIEAAEQAAYMARLKNR